MSFGAFTEKNCRPSQAEIAEVLGAMLQPWQALTEHVRATYHAQQDFKFCYGKNYGWALTFRIKGSLLTALYPARNGFVVQVILRRAALQQALTLGDAVRQAIARAKPYPEGKWLFIPVQSRQDLRDVKSLLALKQGSAPQEKPAASPLAGSRRSLQGRL